MAFRLGDAVIRGELFNVRKNSTHGWLQLRGLRRPVMFELTGNCAPDLYGKHIRFQVRGLPEDEAEEVEETSEIERAQLKELGLSGLRWHQIGPTGDMTAARKVRVADCSPEELYMRCKLGEPPPTEWKQCLYLEWYSQNGRVVLELPDPEIEYVNDEEEDAAGESDTTTAQEDARRDFEADSADADADGTEDDIEGGGLSITAITSDGDVYDVTPTGDDECECDDEDCCGESGAYDVVPKSLERELESQSRQLDRAWRSEGDDDVAEMELMDELIERGPGQPLGMLFDEPLKLKPIEGLDEAAAEQQLKILLAQLAMYGVAVHMCEHFTALDTYRLIIEHLAPEEGAYPELRGTGWVQNFNTGESCPQCEAEFEKDFEEKNRRIEEDLGWRKPKDEGGGGE